MRFKYIEDIDSWLECKKKERERKALLCFFSRTYKIKNFFLNIAIGKTLRAEGPPYHDHVTLHLSHVQLTCSLDGTPFTEWSPARRSPLGAAAGMLGRVGGGLVHTVVIYHSLVTVAGFFA